VRVLLVVSFVAGLIPSVLLLVGYGLRTRFWETDAGKGFFALVAVTASSYLLSLLTLIWPAFFAAGEVPPTGPGLWIRVAIRFAIALVLWNLLWLFVKAQRQGRSTVAPPRPGRRRRSDETPPR
jgi:hypothetical protein